MGNFFNFFFFNLGVSISIADFWKIAKKFHLVNCIFWYYFVSILTTKLYKQ